MFVRTKKNLHWDSISDVGIGIRSQILVMISYQSPVGIIFSLNGNFASNCLHNLCILRMLYLNCQILRLNQLKIIHTCCLCTIWLHLVGVYLKVSCPCHMIFTQKCGFWLISRLPYSFKLSGIAFQNFMYSFCHN
jgi:hypothetical protein